MRPLQKLIATNATGHFLSLFAQVNCLILVAVLKYRWLLEHRLLPVGRAGAQLAFSSSIVAKGGAMIDLTLANHVPFQTKRSDPPYRGGKSKDWIKVKNRAHHAFTRVLEAFA
jgi:hypothetical protein